MYAKFKDKIYDEARKMIVMKKNVKVLMGINATFIKINKDWE